METFVVGIQEVYIRRVEVQANNNEEALILALNKTERCLEDLEYSHILDNSEEWYIYKL